MDQDWKTSLHPNERYPFQLGGKPYIWTRVNGGPLEVRSALKADGSLNAAALDRIADGK